MSRDSKRKAPGLVITVGLRPLGAVAVDRCVRGSSASRDSRAEFRRCTFSLFFGVGRINGVLESERKKKPTGQKNRESGLGTLGCCDESYSGAHISSLHHRTHAHTHAHARTHTQLQTDVHTPLQSEVTLPQKKLCRVTMEKRRY